MKKPIHITLLLCFIGVVAFGQQESQFTNFLYNLQHLNPAHAGTRNVPSFTVLHRNQWIGYKGAPVSQVLNFNTPFFNRRVGFGISVFHRTAGITSSWSGSMAYSYELKMSKELSVRLGLQGTVRFLGIDFSDPDVILTDSDDPSAAMGSNATRYTGNFGVGAFLTYKQLFFGLSVPNFFPNEIGFNDGELITAKEYAHFYAMGGIVLPVSENIDFRPAFLAKYVQNAPADLDVNMSIIFQKEISVGLSYRLGGSGFGESIDLTMFYQLSSQFGAGLSYDVSIGRIAQHNSGSFEALIRYDLRSDREDLTNPRFF